MWVRAETAYEKQEQDAKKHDAGGMEAISVLSYMRQLDDISKENTFFLVGGISEVQARGCSRTTCSIFKRNPFDISRCSHPMKFY